MSSKFPYIDKLYSHVFRTKVTKEKVKAVIADSLLSAAEKELGHLLKELQTNETHGLTIAESDERLERYGYNTIIRERRKPWIVRFATTFYDPLSGLLLILATISLITQDAITAAIIGSMIVLSAGLRFFQENQAYNAAESLRSMVKTTCTVVRGGKSMEISLGRVVPGDILLLSAGDIVPADARIISGRDLYINQSLLTGEPIPVEKHARPTNKKTDSLELENICFMGTDVDSGTARAVIIATGSFTYFGSLAKSIVGRRQETSFDRGISDFTWLMIKFMVVMVPLVFVINSLTKGNWWSALLFATSVAVGLTPEMLPAIVTVNLSKGAIAMSKKKVIVKRLSSIQNFGAMNVLCTDKTGTLTHNKVVLIKSLDIGGNNAEEIVSFAYLNSFYQTGFKNLLDGSVIDYGKERHIVNLPNEFAKVDELPFDFLRRRLSVIVKNATGEHTLICKGAVEETTAICTHYSQAGVVMAFDETSRAKINQLNKDLSMDGFRVIAVATKKISNQKKNYEKTDEQDLVFQGLMAFLDPPKESAAAAIAQLHKYGVEVKVVTGDNDLVTQKICREVNLPVKGILVGSQIEAMTDEQLKEKVPHTTIFAKLSPDHKKRVVEALKAHNHVVGFLGDGINDAPALRAADVGISVDTAVDIAKESADIILLEMNLLVLEDGIIEGRKIFGNITKYIKMSASSNFGNMFSVLGASIFLPFLPMTPLQLLTNNLLYDFSQVAIPTDNVDAEFIERPRKWHIKDIKRFMLYIGPISSIFDYATFGIMLFIFHAWGHPALLQTAWFVESLLTQTLIVHIIRSRKIPFLQTRASKPLIATTFTIIAIGIGLVISPLAPLFGFVALPGLYWPILIGLLLCYTTLTQLVKTWYIKKFGYN